MQKWIEDLPLVDYNFKTGEAAVATGGVATIKTILDLIQLGDFCMAHGSDLILRTSYYLIVRILNFTNGVEFNNFINQMIGVLSDMERQVVDLQLQLIKDPDVDKEYYNSLLETARKAPNFDLYEYTQGIKDIRNRLSSLRERQKQLSKPPPEQPPFQPNFVGSTGHFDPELAHQIIFENQDIPW